ncbi:MAG: tRNA lysidine(34) synthetase TilS [Anaerolineaceae bacterium]|nr:tRNA lysidine(34) synthetase TilS [Anaerolineaceae bacterium]MCB9099576.1 tRNA lysidine(34) synthetase TilS [Anaerolineales bacterium]
MGQDLVEKIKAFCQQNRLITPEDTLLVGVSGGPDSLGLLHILTKLCHDFKLAPPAVAHLNHQLRHPDADIEAGFVRHIAEQWRLPFFSEARPVADLAAQRQQSLEETARQVRYAFLWSLADQIGANKIAVGHNGDDQIETVLMHFLRGSGLTGLRGMAPQVNIALLPLHPYDTIPASSKPVMLIRPLLDTPRLEIETYCRAHQLTPRYDSSNQDTTFFRNRLRHELLPYLETYNPNIRRLLHNTAKIATGEIELVDQQIEQVWPDLVTEVTTQNIDFIRENWLNLPIGLKRATLRRAIYLLHGHLFNITFDHIENAIEVLEKGQTGALMTWPAGLTIRLTYKTISLTLNSAAAWDGALDDDQPAISRPLDIKLPGLTPLPSTNWQLKATLVPMTPAMWPQIKQATRWEAYIDAVVVGNRLKLRTRQPGDQFRPLGAGHSKTIKTFMIDAKIPAAYRRRLPILVADEQILWLCGYRLDDRAKVTEQTRQLVHFTFERI